MTHGSFRAGTIHGVLEAAAADDPGASAVSFVNDTSFTRSELLAEAFEVEQVLLTHPRVAEAAVYAVPGEMGEDDVMAAVVLDGPEPLEPAGLINFAAPRDAYFAVPRFVDILAELPKTSTQKVRTGVRRERDQAASTWDGGRRRRAG